MSSVETLDQPPPYNQVNDPNDQSKSTDENLHNQYPGSNQYPSPGGAQYQGNQYQPQATPLVITQPGVVPMDVKRAPQARDWMVPAVLSCLCCFWPTGICAIMAANNASSAARYGNIIEAKIESRRARNYVIISVIVGIILIVITIILRLHGFTSYRRYQS
uniref:Proline-rich transmembrane protein 1 n=1 Tax=Magallana gigas TaxID=29159 RepID=A0A8W8JIN8_MAGGI|nr:proline-rich transmembrane protein 1 [Crassostrea gigas]